MKNENNQNIVQQIKLITQPLPEEIICPGCEHTLILDEKERKTRIFYCPSCSKSFDYRFKKYEIKASTGSNNAKQAAKISWKEKLSSDLIDEKEKIVLNIGQLYSTSLLLGEGLYKTSLLLTNKRIYGAGKGIILKGKRKMSFIGYLSELTSISFYESSNLALLIFAILGILIGFTGSSTGEKIESFFPILIIGLILLLFYFLSKQKFISIDFKGVTYTISIRGVSKKEIQKFIRAAMLIRDKIAQ